MNNAHELSAIVYLKKKFISSPLLHVTRNERQEMSTAYRESQLELERYTDIYIKKTQNFDAIRAYKREFLSGGTANLIHRWIIAV